MDKDSGLDCYILCKEARARIPKLASASTEPVGSLALALSPFLLKLIHEPHLYIHFPLLYHCTCSIINMLALTAG